MEYKTETGQHGTKFGDLRPGELFRWSDQPHGVLICGHFGKATYLACGSVDKFAESAPVVRMKFKDGLPVFVDA